MNTQRHNWMYGKALYLEVRDTVFSNSEPLGNLDVRRILVNKHNYQGSSDDLEDLYWRISRTTNQLYLDGYLDRASVLAKNKNMKYVYTPKKNPTC